MQFMKSIKAIIRANKHVTGHLWRLMVHAPAVARNCSPGQFLSIRVSQETAPLLRRPFSIAGVDGQEIEILYDVVGEGTRILTEHKKGDELDILGPLGHGFHIGSKRCEHMLVGGGIGIAGLKYLASVLSEKKYPTTCFLGAGSKSRIYGLKDMQKLSITTHIATDDGSVGFNGTVTGLFLSYINKYRPDKIAVYSCGPLPMLKSLAKICADSKIPLQCSLESRMACGIGVCNGCVVKVPDKLSPEGFHYARICADGPVFDSDKILFE